jgi:homoserine kinase type II
MAVFTTVSRAELEEWLLPFGVGNLTHFEGISSGIENTNYFVDTTTGRFVLTLFEKLQAGELDYYLNLMAHLAGRGIPSPRPMPGADGRLQSMLCGKPACLATRLPGQSNMSPGAEECAAFGETVARLHLAGADFAGFLENPRGPAWWVSTARAVKPFLNAQQSTLLSRELAFQTGHRFDDLPRGPIHADLFRDNVLMNGKAVGGVIDFYFAGHDAWLYDLAIVVNDWCMTPEARLDPARVNALLGAYQSVRPITAAEREAWPVMLRAAALRFFLSRSYDKYLPRKSALLTPHDPSWFERILTQHSEHPTPWPL